MIEEHNYEFVGDFDSAWNYYREYLDSGGEEDKTIPPTYIGKENRKGDRLYGVGTTDEKDRKYDPERHPRIDGW